MFMCNCFQNGGRERTKSLPLLNQRIDPVLHLRPTWIGENRSCSKRARAKFHTARHPGYYLSFEQPVNDVFNQRRWASAVVSKFYSRGIQEMPNLIARIGWAQISVL